jgi:hypothetical protein
MLELQDNDQALCDIPMGRGVDKFTLRSDSVCYPSVVALALVVFRISKQQLRFAPIATTSLTTRI